MTENKQKGSVAALLPIGVFLLLFLGSGFLSGDFYAMPAVLAFLIALLLLLSRTESMILTKKFILLPRA